jgi:hypothetical protein
MLRSGRQWNLKSKTELKGSVLFKVHQKITMESTSQKLAALRFTRLNVIR